MLIDRIELFRVAPRWLFLRVETDDGVVGWGEPIVEGRTGTVEAAVREMSEEIIGRDPTRIEDIWQSLTRQGFYRGGPVFASAVAGIDQALWDVAGKAFGLAVHQMLGGRVRDRVRIYGGIDGDTARELAADTQSKVDSGLTLVKLSGGGPIGALDSRAAIQSLTERVEAVRETIGSDHDLAVDFHGRYTPAMAKRALRAIEQFDPLFVEEPVVPELTWRIGELVDGTSIPIATGERLYSRTEFLPALQAGVAVVQPDLSHAGGISEVRRIAAAAETHGVLLAPHCPLGPIAFAASVQVDAATPNFLAQEQALRLENPDESLARDLFDLESFGYSAGHVHPPAAPGLGLKIDESALRRAARVGHEWRTPSWRASDGAVAEW